MPLTELVLDTDQYADDPEYQFYCVALDAGEQIAARMDELGLTNDALAARMGVSARRVRDILQCGDRMTLMGIVAAATALGCRVKVEMEPAQ